MPSKKIAFLKSPTIRKISRYFIGIGDILSRTSPYTSVTLRRRMRIVMVMDARIRKGLEFGDLERCLRNDG